MFIRQNCLQIYQERFSNWGKSLQGNKADFGVDQSTATLLMWISMAKLPLHQLYDIYFITTGSTGRRAENIASKNATLRVTQGIYFAGVSLPG